MFKLALAQMRVEGGAKEANLARAATFVADAASAGAQVVLLPETLNLGWTHASARTAQEEIPGGETSEWLRALAQRHGVYLCAGLVESAGDLRFNAAVLFDPQGRLLLHHRKLNELDIAHALYANGDRLGVAHTPLGTLGVMICADAFARGHVVSRTLGLMGAQIILSPCAWAVPADHDNARLPYGWRWLESYCPVARDFQLWIAGCSNVGWINDGPWRGRKCIGNSLVVNPRGEPVLHGPHGVDAEALLLIDVALEPHARGREL
ncbi:MAG: carbon-nitrogen hydrolase family protein [Opitutaceae bacterium]|nr:carbon-nitrogen hydrolase family protein [Opitutaceae bacterium]